MDWIIDVVLEKAKSQDEADIFAFISDLVCGRCIIFLSRQLPGADISYNHQHHPEHNRYVFIHYF